MSLTIESSSRQVIERKLLTAMEGDETVAVVLTCRDIDMLIGALGRKNVNEHVDAREVQFATDLEALRVAAFGDPEAADDYEQEMWETE